VNNLLPKIEKDFIYFGACVCHYTCGRRQVGRGRCWQRLAGNASVAPAQDAPALAPQQMLSTYRARPHGRLHLRRVKERAPSAPGMRQYQTPELAPALAGATAEATYSAAERRRFVCGHQVPPHAPQLEPVAWQYADCM